MSRKLRSLAGALAVAAIPALMAAGWAELQVDVQAQQADQLDQVVVEQSAAEIVAYWTSERMAAAIPMPIPAEADPNAGLPQLDGEASVADGPPGFAPGWDALSGLAQPGADAAFSLEEFTAQLEQPQHGAKPTNPKDGPYGPFQRMTHARRFTAYPSSPIGKLFFSLGTSNFVCSASVIQKNTVVTAGHCNYGNGAFATNRMFCPSYNNNGVNPERGCWGVVNSKTSAGWVQNGDPDYDYACLIMATSGTVWGTSIGNVTGWFGRAWNFSYQQAEKSFGYPQASPFNGRVIVEVAGTGWYEHDFRSGGQVSKLMGNDMTGGSSGGPWILGFNHPTAEFPDTDGSIATDPGGNWVNGVNSHKRCSGNCSSPPTTTTGVFWQEMSSPPFRNTANDNDESEDNFAVCFNNGGV